MEVVFFVSPSFLHQKQKANNTRFLQQLMMNKVRCNENNWLARQERIDYLQIQHLNIINIVNKKLNSQMFHSQFPSSSNHQPSSVGAAEQTTQVIFSQDQQANLKCNNNLVNSHGNQSADEAVLCSQKKVSDKAVESKLRYKKLKQKLSVLSEQIQDQGLLKDQKDITSPNKARLMKLALELEKSLKTQSIDYQLVDSTLRQIQKILEHRREHDILILRGARLFNNLFAILRRFPSLHKNEAVQSMIALQLSLKLMRIMLNLNSSRQLFLVSNQIVSIISLFNCALMRQQKKIAVYCLILLNSVIGGQNRIQLQPLLKANVQYILCSPLLKRLKCYLQACLLEDDPSYSQFILLAFKFYHLLFSTSCKEYLYRPIYDSQKIPNSLSQAINSNLQGSIQLLTQSINELSHDKQNEAEQKYTYREQQIPNFKINIILYIYKILNIIFYVDLVQAQEMIERNNLFLNTLYLFNYIKQHINDTLQTKGLCSEIILFIGNLALQNHNNQEIIRKSGLLVSLCDHPLEYIMVKELKNILIPTFCSVIYQNSHNFQQTFSQYSAHSLIQYIEKQINSLNERKFEEQSGIVSGKNYCRTLSRKTSVSSINSNYSKASISESFSTQASYNTIEKQIRFEHRFRPQYWQGLVEQLRKLDD